MKTINPLLKFFKYLYKAVILTISHDGVEHAGYMAFLNILSIFPFTVFIIAFTGFLGDSQIGSEFVNVLFESLPEELTAALMPRVHEILSGPSPGLITISVVGAIWTASSSVEGIRTILNRAYRIKTPPTYILRRLLSVFQFFILTSIILISMLALVFLPAAYNQLNNFLHINDLMDIKGDFSISIYSPVWSNTRFIILFITMLLVVNSLYYLIPNVRQKFKAQLPGSLLVVVLWYLSGSILSTYIKKFDQVNLIYGSLGGIIASLLFFFFANLIFIYGAEFNYLIHKQINKKSFLT